MRLRFGRVELDEAANTVSIDALGEMGALRLRGAEGLRLDHQRRRRDIIAAAAGRRRRPVVRGVVVRRPHRCALWESCTLMSA